MNISRIRITNFRRLKDVQIEFDPEATTFVGPNNSGKTSAIEIFGIFLGSGRFSLYDFSADCLRLFDDVGRGTRLPAELPVIGLDVWFSVQENDLYRAIKILPGLDWKDSPLGLRVEFRPKAAEELLERFREAQKMRPQAPAGNTGETQMVYRAWPEKFTDYLERRLHTEYDTSYYVLDHSRFDKNYKPATDYVPSPLGDSTESGKRILNSLVKVDFISAQRHLSDTSAQELSKQLNEFYRRNAAKPIIDIQSLQALWNSEAELDKHLAAVFAPTLKRLDSLGYPGFAEPNLVVKSLFDPENILVGKASVHYSLRDPGRTAPQDPWPTLPEKYNGLGFKNLIYMVIEILGFHAKWTDEEQDRPPLHLVMIEEPEAHLHVQLQQVFIRKIMDLLRDADTQFQTQLVVTTHSPHVVHESGFRPVRYFRRVSRGLPTNYSDVLNLSKMDNEDETGTHRFLQQYMKLTHCDLFFADAAILVEGNSERLVMPLLIEKMGNDEMRRLKGSYLTILEVGGAFAHKFRDLINFLGITTLIVTDLDSICPPNDGAGEHADTGKCPADTPNAVTSNETLRQWLPRKTLIAELLSASEGDKAPPPTETEPAKVRVAYQTARTATWNRESKALTARTFEEAFAYDNLAWCQEAAQRELGLRISDNGAAPSLDNLAKQIYTRVNHGGLDKTKFALGLMAAKPSEWTVPHYIEEGLRWLAESLTAVPLEAAVSPTEAQPEHK